MCVHQWEREGVDQLELAQRLSGYWATLTNQGICEWTCPQGHNVRFIFQTPFYILLFRKGETDLARRDTRSATLSFYSAWDSFVAFTCEMLLNEAGIVDRVPARVKLAEPLLGMFVGLVAARTGKYPTLVDSKIAKIRNEVIHGDHIPQEADALDVGGAVQKAIRATRKAVADFDAKEVKASAARLLKAAGDTKPDEHKDLITIWVGSDFDSDLEAKITAIRHERASENGFAPS
jgi:hypothetical protein